MATILIAQRRNSDMTPINDLPSEFDLALQRKGLKREVCMGPQVLPFGNIIIEYFNKQIGIQVMRDRDIWSISLKDIVHLPGRWFPLWYLHGIISNGSGKKLSFRESQLFVEAHWEELLALFNDQHRDETVRRVNLMFKARVSQNTHDALERRNRRLGLSQ
jgi:hypothetical protein